MSSSLQEQLDVWPLHADGHERAVYEQAFVRTVVRLRGLDGSSILQQAQIGKKVLSLYDIKVAVARIRLPQQESETLASGLSRLNAVEHAFMLVRFDSVLPPTAEQLKALNAWLAA